MHSLCVLFPPKITREHNLLVERWALPTCQDLHSKSAGTRAAVVTTVVLGTALSSHSLLNLDNFADCWNLLFICDGLVAAVTDPHFKLEAHQGDGGTFGAALAADGLPALAAVVLQRENQDLLGRPCLGVLGYAQQ